ncbi:helix-turn-helix domain-containing protein [Stutzerimonas stutzeri]|uniref:DUF6945 domain-containing protein n=1 Tax=Stutzerimonas stutzeri TaxID=316 RepID=UPI000F7A006C|nr:hypothetical protein [Stutzerimonas stutzeri]MDH0728199.1 helix-turn-helix domain-containing protein [Stutzerimonas stutzeri]RRV75032.1 hypothetical protein EGJ18_07575 [Stutzerimonas stutzeri]
MATQLFAKSEQQLDIYLPAYKNILSAKGFVGVEVEKDTGEIKQVVKPFSAEQKLVWLYVLDRYKFFTDDKRAYFDNQIDIGNACGVSESTVKRFFRALREAGYLTAHETRIGGHKSNSYVIHRDLVLVQEDAAKAPVQAKEQPTQAPQELAAPTMDDFVPASAEWASEAVPMDAYDDFMPEPEDDGSYADALSYSELETIEQPVSVSVPAAKQLSASGIDGIDLSTLPDICYERNGSINDRMWDWLDARGFYVEDPDNCIVHLNGTRYAFIGRQFEVCTKQVEEEEFSPF